MTTNPHLKAWVREMAEMCQPDDVVWCTGSESQFEDLRAQAVKSGELIALNSQKLPNCFLHRSDSNDVARVEGLTYICTEQQSQAGVTNNWMAPEEGYRKARAIFEGSMKGRTMYVVPFCMGPLGSPMSKFGVELTDSIYVVLNMALMTRMGQDVLQALGDSDDFTRCLHGKADLNMERRLILHFPEDNTIWSVGSGYGGNALLGKKCLALRIGSYLGAQEGWMAEHMLVLGVEYPDGHVEYIAAAFPSACGKTNLAMIIPPEGLKHKGYKIWTVGDDIAWLRPGENGELRAINPEFGFFGVLPGTNDKTNHNAIASMQKNSIYTNVVLNTEDQTVWWEDGPGEAPQQALDWQGKAWSASSGQKGAHPNSRFTSPLSQCPSISAELDNPQGVEISAIVFGGRRARVAPLVYEAFSWQHGVFVGSTMASERTAAQLGKQGEIRRDPMAMLPFCGYNMGKYFEHWLNIGKRLTKQPKVFHVNWFSQDDQGEYLWPGFSDNLRVLEWILARCKDQVSARKTEIGYLPNSAEDLDLNGLTLSAGALETLFAVDHQAWQGELESIEQHLRTFGEDLPQELWSEYEALKGRLSSGMTG